MFPMQGNTESTSAILYVDDVFSAYTYTGNGGTQNIVNGIDLAGKGGMVWCKRRNGASDGHAIADTVRGAGNLLDSASAGANLSRPTTISGFLSNGFSLGTDGFSKCNSNGDTYVGWTFRKAPKFFDVVTYTGNGANRTIAHSLGQVPGMIIVKRTDNTGSWMVYHNSIANTENLVLNTTAAKATNATAWNSTPATISVFNLGTHADVNTNAASYVAYLFAHDASTDGIIQCGSFTTDGSGNATVTLGWEPQFLITKAASSATYNDWLMFDSSRDLATTSGARNTLKPNTSVAEAAYGNGFYNVSATGFSLIAGNVNNSTQHIYLAIRRPNKPPTSGTQVYNAIARTGTGAAATVTGVGFAPELMLTKARGVPYAPLWASRLTSAGILYSSSTAAEGTNATVIDAATWSYTMDGIKLPGNGAATNESAITYINHFFKRAPGVFDQVCYTGTGVAKTEPHSLGVVPELMIVKSRISGSESWAVYYGDNTKYLFLNSTGTPGTNSTYWNNTSPTSLAFSVGPNGSTGAATNYVNYLFATKAGISKVGSYTGNGSIQTINCGFTTGARFVLIKRTDVTGDWFVWDSIRNIIAGNDPHLSLNTTAAEVTTDDSVDPDTSGFIVNQVAATNINVNGSTYIFLSFA